jgi:hypothetical protein
MVDGKKSAVPKRLLTSGISVENIGVLKNSSRLGSVSIGVADRFSYNGPNRSCKMSEDPEMFGQGV